MGINTDLLELPELDGGEIASLPDILDWEGGDLESALESCLSSAVTVHPDLPENAVETACAVPETQDDPSIDLETSKSAGAILEGQLSFPGLSTISEGEALPTTTTANDVADAGGAAGSDTGREAVQGEAEKKSPEKISQRNEKYFSRLDSWISEKSKLENQIHDQKIFISDIAEKISVLKAQAKDANKNLKEAVEDLVELRAKLEGLEESRPEMLEYNPGDVVEARPASPTSAATASTATSAADGPVPRDEATAPAIAPIDPGATAPLTVLKISKGRLEKLQETDRGDGITCKTVGDLERLIRDGRLQTLKGFGEKAVDAVTDALIDWWSKNPVPEPVGEVGLPEMRFRVNGELPAEEPEKNPVEQNQVVDSAQSRESSDGVLDGIQTSGEPSTAPPSTESSAESDPLIEIPADLANENDPILIDAYRDGCAAAVDDKPVTANPHQRGTQEWRWFDRGWLDCFDGGDDEGDGECEEV